MGNVSGTPRKVTVQNEAEESTNVIKVSDRIAQRLRGAPEEIQDTVRGDVIQDENELYWHRRLDNLEDSHRRMVQHMEDEIARAQAEVRQWLQKTPDTEEEPPCMDAKELVMKCYQEHPKQSLLCARLVRIYQQCVNGRILDVIDQKGTRQ
ncbi:MICOS complex subunit mic25-b [Anabrus simplex]|uniref:MICOS complex subunit mic25-b n=1 Tax=Anabrus simplex TaxID=316456 RepID=UPI0034DCD6ED